jgi:hypothetical protein
MKNCFTLLFACIFLAGCLPEKKVIWSPDGLRAAVLGLEGLYLCDDQGKLSSLQMTQVIAAAWLPDSERLVVSRVLTITAWKDLAGQLAPTQLQAVTDLGNALLPRIKAGGKLEGKYKKEDQNQGDYTLAAALLYLRDTQPQAFQSWAKTNEEDSRPASNVHLFTLQVVRIPLEKAVAAGPVLARSLARPAEIRPAPTGMAVAWVNQTNALFVALTDGSQPAQLVEPRAALFPDWSPDGRALVYIKPVGEADVQVGVLARKTLVDETGKMTVTNATEDLAGMLYDTTSKVRCLRDGRILFSSVELRLPLTAKEMPQREQLFALDLARQATVIRLVPREIEEEIPQKCWSFEVSPDEKRLAIAADDGRIVVLTVAAGTIDTVQSRRDDKAFKFVPTWRSAAELCFASLPEKTNEVQKPGIALWNAGKIRLLSNDWPTNVVSGLMAN